MTFEVTESREGARSAEAVRDAAAKLPDNAADIVRSARAIVSDPQATRDDEPEIVVPPTDDRDGGTSPTPATPKGDDDAVPAEGDDYDEEDHVAEPEPEADRPEDAHVDAAAPNAATPKDPDAVWNQYKDDEERKKAFAENKRYAIEQAEEAKRLKAENEALKAGKPAEVQTPEEPAQPAVEDTPETRKAIATRLYAERPEVKQIVDNLGSIRNIIATKSEALDKLESARDAAVKTQTELTHEVRVLESRFKKAPENFELETDLENAKARLREVGNEINAHKLEIRVLDAEIGDAERDYNAGADRVIGHVTGEIKRSTEEAKAAVSYKDEHDKNVKAWTEQFPAAMDAFGVDKDDKELRNSIERRLLSELSFVIQADPQGRWPDLAPWLKSKYGEIQKEQKVLGDRAVKGYLATKKKDAASPAPSGTDAVAPVKKRDRYDSKQAHRDAEERMKQAFRA